MSSPQQQKPLHKSTSFPAKSPLRSHNESSKSKSSWARPKITLKKSLSVSRDLSSKFSSGKRVRLEQENGIDEDSGLGPESGSSGKRPAGLNPFARSISLDSPAEITLEPFNLESALNFAASSLVEGLHSYSGDILSKNSEAADLPTEVTPVIEKKLFIPYKDYFDWSLKTKLCLTTPDVVEFIANLTSEDRFRSSRVPRSEGASKGAKFLQLLWYWMFPVLSGTSTFPRNFDPAVSDQVPTNWSKMMPSLYDDWEASIMELLDAVTFGECPYFYFVTHQWTALILAKELDHSDVPVERAYITPTTSGFRNMLKDNDLNLTMPLLPKTSGVDAQNEDLDTSSGSDGSFTNLEWIKAQCKRVGKVIKAVKVEQKDQIFDNRPESLVALQDKDVARFIIALIKNRALQPNGGPLTNVPPTLVAPVFFTNASGKKVDYTSGKASEFSFLNISGGPVLPHLLPCLARLLGSSDHGESACFSYTTLEISGGFTKITKTPEVTEHVVDIGLDTAKLKDVLAGRSSHQHQSDDINATMKSLMNDFRFL